MGNLRDRQSDMNPTPVPNAEKTSRDLLAFVVRDSGPIVGFLIPDHLAARRMIWMFPDMGEHPEQ
jgi:hypothetical protein